MQTLWKKTTALHPAFKLINKCLTTDWSFLPFELQIQRAHARALNRAGLLTAKEYRALVDALNYIAFTYGDTPCPASAAEDIHTWTESMLTHLAGDAGKKIHTARSRNDQVATMMKMYVISSGNRLLDDLNELIKTCSSKAKAFSELIMPLMTHTQFAAPGSVGSWMLKYALAFERVSRHVGYCVRQWKQDCPLGSGAVAGSSITIDRQVQAQELGFESASLNAIDSTSTRDECLELLALATQVALHLQSLATDVILFAQTPLGWIDYPHAFGTGSSMMPNKANPDAMELLRGECNQISAAHTQAVMLLKGLPSGYNRDVQCIKPIVLDSMEKLHDLCVMTQAFVEQLAFDQEKLNASLQQGHITATHKMEQLVCDGLPLREAHAIIAEQAASHSAGTVQEAAAAVAGYKTVGCAGVAETVRVAEQLVQSESP